MFNPFHHVQPISGCHTGPQATEKGSIQGPFQVDVLVCFIDVLYHLHQPVLKPIMILICGAKNFDHWEWPLLIRLHTRWGRAAVLHARLKLLATSGVFPFCTTQWRKFETSAGKAKPRITMMVYQARIMAKILVSSEYYCYMT